MPESTRPTTRDTLCLDEARAFVAAAEEIVTTTITQLERFTGLRVTGLDVIRAQTFGGEPSLHRARLIAELPREE